MNYYYSIDGTEVNGPYTLSELTSYFASGAIPKATQVCLEGAQTWQPLSAVIDTGSARPTQAAIAAEIGQRQSVRSSRPASTGTTVTKACPMCGEQILPTAKKCKHCGEFLDATLRAAANPTKEPSDALGIVIFLLPLASAALMWFWISSMNLLQNPSSTLMGITIVTILATSALMAVEASQLRMGGKRDGKATTGPAGWFLCGLLLWIVAFPAYLYSRSKFGVKNYVVGGLVSALVFLGVAFTLNTAIESQKASVRRNLEESQDRLRELQRSFERFSR